jgi:hypothetical protein
LTVASLAVALQQQHCISCGAVSASQAQLAASAKAAAEMSSWPQGAAITLAVAPVPAAAASHL